MRSIYKFFDKLEDRIRRKLSHYPVVYAFFGGVGVVLFWRGVWHSADYLMEMIFTVVPKDSVDLGALPWWDGPLSLLVGGVLLLSTGLFVSGFIGNEIIISGLRGEKKMTEKTEEEVKVETNLVSDIEKEVRDIASRLEDLENELKSKNNS